MKLKLLIFFLTALNLSIQAQINNPYYEHINNALKDYVNNDFNSADSAYKLAFSSANKPFNKDLLYAAINSFKRKDTADIKNYMLMFSERGGNYKMLKRKFKNNSFLSITNNDSLFSFLIRERELKRKMKANYKNYWQLHINKKISKKINRMSFVDQFLLRMGPHILLISEKKQFKLMSKYDRRNAIKLFEICQDIDGFVGFNVIGEDYKNGQFRLSKLDLMLRHFNEEELDKLKPYIEKSINNLNFYLDTWAGVLDYSSQIKFDPKDTTRIIVQQKYGTLLRSPNYVIVPFGDIETVNKNRRELQLCDIITYSKFRQAKLPSEKKLYIKRK